MKMLINQESQERRKERSRKTLKANLRFKRSRDGK